MPKIILIVISDDGDVQVHHIGNDTPVTPKLSDSAPIWENYLEKCKEIDERNKTKGS